MSGDFVGLKQLSISINSSTSTPLTIPTDIAGFPKGQPLVIKVVSDVKSAFKISNSNDAASKALTSDALPDGNIYAYANAIETYKAISVSSNSTPTTIHAIGVSSSGNFDVCFGYYI